MSGPVKMGMVVTQPTDFVEGNPQFVAHVRRNMERDIRDSGRLVDEASWKREDHEEAVLRPMTTFTLDAMSEAHVIVLVEPDGHHAWTKVHEVQLGSLEQAQARVDALNAEHAHTDYDEEDGVWWGEHYAVKTVPLGYPESAVQVTNRFPAQRLADSQRAIRMSAERMRW